MGINPFTSRGRVEIRCLSGEPERRTEGRERVRGVQRKVAFMANETLVLKKTTKMLVVASFA